MIMSVSPVSVIGDINGRETSEDNIHPDSDPMI